MNSKLTQIGEKIDKSLYVWAIKRRSFKIERDYVSYVARNRGISDNEHIFQVFDNIDTKSPALLTHASIIIASLSLFISRGNIKDWKTTIITIELIVYLLVAITLLRCIKIINGQASFEINRKNIPFNTSQSRERYETKKEFLPLFREYILRMELYSVANRYTIWAKLFLLLLVPAMVLF